MRIQHIILFLLSSIPAFTLATQLPLDIHYRPNTQAMIPAEVEMTTPSISLPVIIGDLVNCPIIKVMINGQGPFLFALDTGFSQTLISKELTDKLNLPIIKKDNVKYITPHGTTYQPENIVLINKFQIGEMIASNYAVIGSGTSAQDEAKFKKRGIDGLLSINAFQDVLLVLDYKNEMLHIQKGELSASDKDVLKCRQGYDIPVVEANIQSENVMDRPYHFILDTGEPNYIYINACAMPVNKLFQINERFKQYDIFGNPSETYLGQLNGNIKVTNQTFIKSPHVTFSEKDCKNSPPPGRFGTKFFEKYEVTFDNKNDLVKIK